MRNFIGLILLVGILLVSDFHAAAQLPPPPGQEVYRKELACDWEFSAVDSSKWRPAQVPGCVHTDLVRNGVIADPLLGTNEHTCQWIGETDWFYRTSEFDLPKEAQGRNTLFLIFNGLDTYADIFLNEEHILSANNAFRTWRVDVKRLVRKKGNRITIRFKSPVREGEIIQSNLPYPLPGDGLRAVTRKPQYHYGWDWGPRLITSGITASIEWLAWDVARFEDVYIRQDKVTEKEAALTAVFEVQVEQNDPCSLFFHIPYLAESYQTSLVLKKGLNLVELPLKLPYPRLWWCNGQGDPFLHTFHAWLKSEGRVLDQKVLRTGVRNLDLVTKKDSIGESFQFELNGIPVFAKGANMIPITYFPAQATDEDYRSLLTKCKDAHFNMIRVWGGGVYEKDIFYDLCDEMGIMVWQDFMFACSMYPADSVFITNVIEEASQQTRRLRNHASIALWCGNNETSEGWERWGWQFDLSEKDRVRLKRAYDDLFSLTLAPIVKKNTKVRYWESSPLYGRGDSRSMREGDCHYWGLWHDEEPFEILLQKIPRFMSEFGVQSFPSPEVLRLMCNGDKPTQQHPGIAAHQKHPRGFKLMKDYQRAWYPAFDETDIERYARLTQVVQAEGMCAGIEAQRRASPRCMGSLYWQLNDVWPSFSWSSIDYLGKDKLFFTMLKESFAPKLITIETTKDKLRVYFLNDHVKPEMETLDLYLAVRTCEGKELFSRSTIDHRLPNGLTLLFEGNLDEILHGQSAKDNVIIVELRDTNAQTQYRRYTKLIPESDRFFIPAQSNGYTWPQLMQME